MSDAPEAPAERGRVIAYGRRTDDGVRTTLQVVHEADGSWTVHGPAAPGVQLSAAGAFSLAESIIARAPREPVMAWYLVSTRGPSTHHGVLADGRLSTDCGGVFASRSAVRLDLGPGEAPPDFQQVCPLCLGEAQ